MSDMKTYPSTGGRRPELADEFFAGDVVMANCITVLALAKRKGIQSLTDSEIASRAISAQKCFGGRPLQGCDLLTASQALRRLMKGGWVIRSACRSYQLDPSVEVEMSPRLKQTGGTRISFRDISAPDA